jgi:NACHT domain-containing protein
LLRSIKALEDNQRALGTENITSMVSALERIVQSIHEFKQQQTVQESLQLHEAREPSKTPSSEHGNKPQERVVLSVPKTMETWSQILSSQAELGPDMIAKQRILRSLMFPEMKLRLSNIAEAHQKTYTWAYDIEQEDLTPFISWLRDGSGVFWVAGKAGSGKSTFMKHISLATSTTQLLNQWANEKTLVTASFFFWNSGSPLQRSQEGLLRSLLFQALAKCPQLIPAVCPERWRHAPANNFAHEEWTLMELLESLGNFLKQNITDTVFCLFVDGLDEYRGEPFDLVKLLQCLQNTSCIKMCLSSRPWNCFQDAFGKDKSTHLRLEQHNHKISSDMSMI